MASHTLFDEFLTPEILPLSNFVAEGNVAFYSESTEFPIVCEVFEKDNQLYGFRFQTWVAYRDAGDFVRGHNWQVFETESLITDNVKEAIESANFCANSKGIKLSETWLANPSFNRDLLKQAR